MPPRKTAKQQHRALLYRARKDYDALLEKQGGVCGICTRAPAEGERFHIDHHHGEKVVRGVLCPWCNRNLRKWMKPGWMRLAADYLERFENRKIG